MRIVLDKAKFENTGQLFRKNKILNVYQLKILNTGMFMYRVSIKTAPSVLHPRFQRLSDSYSTNFSESNNSLSAHNLK